MDIPAGPSQPPPEQDLVTRLGPLMLGSRLKRLGEQMQAGVAAHIAGRGLALLPAHLPPLIALADNGPMTVGALSACVGISQPGITRALARLEALDLVAPAESTGDRRRRPMRLTPAGASLLATLRAELFPAVGKAAQTLCDAAPGDLLAAIAAVERALRANPLDRRIAEAQNAAPADHAPGTHTRHRPLASNATKEPTPDHDD